MPKRLLPLAAMEKVMKESGAERVSEGAKASLKQALEIYGLKLSASAWEYAKHAGRKTIKEEDIRLAAKEANN
ncbi:MAG: histone [archaeon]